MSSKTQTPKNYRALARQYPRFMAAIDALGAAAANAGPLTEKTRHLVQIGAAAALRSASLANRPLWAKTHPPGLRMETGWHISGFKEGKKV